MALRDLREQISAKVQNLDEQQLTNLIAYINTIEEISLPESYDADNDPAIGFINDVEFDARNLKQFLKDNITKDGWRQADTE